MIHIFGPYGIEETIGPHVILSNLFWWASLILVIAAYKNRHIWNVGEMPWTLLFLTFLFFGIRELGHFTASPLWNSLRYIFGICSGIFMTSTMIFLFVKIYKRKAISRPVYFMPFILAAAFPIFFIFQYLSGTRMENIIILFSSMENVIWITGSSITIYTTYMLGTKSIGGFVNFFMFFQFAAICALLWKFLGIIVTTGCTIPYYTREILETLFAVFAILSIYVLERMLRNFSRDIS